MKIGLFRVQNGKMQITNPLSWPKSFLDIIPISLSDGNATASAGNILVQLTPGIITRIKMRPGDIVTIKAENSASLDFLAVLGQGKEGKENGKETEKEKEEKEKEKENPKSTREAAYSINYILS